MLVHNTWLKIRVVNVATTHPICFVSKCSLGILYVLATAQGSYHLPVQLLNEVLVLRLLVRVELEDAGIGMVDKMVGREVLLLLQVA